MLVCYCAVLYSFLLTTKPYFVKTLDTHDKSDTMLLINSVIKQSQFHERRWLNCDCNAIATKKYILKSEKKWYIKSLL